MSEMENETYVDGPPTPVNSPEPPAKKQRVKRAPSAYNNFVKETYSTLTDIPAKERFAECSRLWKQQKQQKEEAVSEASKPKPKKKVVRKKK